MRCVFAFEICLIHLCTVLWYVPQDGWMAQTIFMSVARTGTVGFLMLAAAILISRPPGQTPAYFSARLRRWLPTLVLAQVLYGALSLFTGAEVAAELSWFDAIDPAWYHIWFFYALGLVYLVVPPMRYYAAWANAQTTAVRRAALWLPVALFAAGLAWVTSLGGFWGDLRPLNLLVYCGYAWTGYVLRTIFPNGTAWSGRLMLAGVVGTVLSTTLASEAAGVPVPYYFHRGSVFVAISAIGLFLLLLRVNTTNWSTATIGRLHAVARLTLGIFIVHPLLIVLARWPLDWALTGQMDWLALPTAALVLFAASGLVTWIFLHGMATLRRIPYVMRHSYLARPPVTHPSKPRSPPASRPHPPQSSSP